MYIIYYNPCNLKKLDIFSIFIVKLSTGRLNNILQDTQPITERTMIRTKGLFPIPVQYYIEKQTTVKLQSPQTFVHWSGSLTTILDLFFFHGKMHFKSQATNVQVYFWSIAHFYFGGRRYHLSTKSFIFIDSILNRSAPKGKI